MYSHSCHATYLSFLQSSSDGFLIDSLMKIPNHPFLSVYHVFLSLSLTCYFFSHYFCPLLIPVMIFYVMQFNLSSLSSPAYFHCPFFSSYGVGFFPPWCSCKFLRVISPHRSFSWLSFLLFSRLEWLLFFSGLRVSDPHFLQASTILESSMLSFLLCSVLKSHLKT